MRCHRTFPIHYGYHAFMLSLQVQYFHKPICTIPSTLKANTQCISRCAANPRRMATFLRGESFGSISPCPLPRHWMAFEKLGYVTWQQRVSEWWIRVFLMSLVMKPFILCHEWHCLVQIQPLFTLSQGFHGNRGICVQGSAKGWSPGCVNASGKIRQRW